MNISRRNFLQLSFASAVLASLPFFDLSGQDWLTSTAPELMPAWQNFLETPTNYGSRRAGCSVATLLCPACVSEQLGKHLREFRTIRLLLSEVEGATQLA